ncbi:class I SAM-dependent methyltransferase [Geoglobus acetivorans]|uniref:Methyltransferase type 11 n=1 Tax=Geoglobus acetivorans TaxID=565033 RepID=A0A0A7GF42_GEOAI|nr:Methyltransferase type 11 [Geoglobus acetivorans]
MMKHLFKGKLGNSKRNLIKAGQINREQLHKKLMEYYNKNKKYYENMLLSAPFESYRMYMDYLKPESGKKVLDVGCGVGTVVHHLSEQGFEAYGIDVSPIAIEIARKSGSGTFKVYDGKKFPFPNNYFDSAGCKDTLEHTVYPEHLLDEMIRVVKPGGKIVISCPNFFRVIGFYEHHPLMSGLRNRLLNFFLLAEKYIAYRLSKKEKIEFMFIDPILDESPAPDKDAVFATNPIDIIFYLKYKDGEIIYYSGNNNYCKNKLLNEISDFPIIKSFTGSFFIVAKKVKNYD